MDIVSTVLGHPAGRHLSVAFSPDEADLRRLVSLLDIFRPKVILEYGSGWSTLVMAAWVRQHDGAFLESLESDPIWYTSTYRTLSETNADITERFVGGNNKVNQYRKEEHEPQERWRLLFSPVVNGRDPDSVLFTYQCTTKPDFVYVDGPALWGKRLVTENTYVTLDRSHPMVFLVDGRLYMAARLYHSYRSRGYSWLYAMKSSCSLVYHEAYAHVGEWFGANEECRRPEISESGEVTV